VRATWRKRPKEWRRKRLWRNLPALLKKHLRLNVGSTCRILPTCIVFWRRAHLHSTAAGNISANSRTTKARIAAKTFPPALTGAQTSQEAVKAAQAGPINDCMCFEQFKYSFIPYSPSPIVTSFSQAPLLPMQLAGDYCRPLGTSGGSGIPVGAYSCPTSEGNTLSTDQSPTPIRKKYRSC